jgi:hypothetical protein
MIPCQYKLMLLGLQYMKLDSRPMIMLSFIYDPFILIVLFSMFSFMIL